MVNKEQLVEKCEFELDVMEDWHEFNEFCNKKIRELLPYVSAEGLRFLRREMRDVFKSGNFR